MPSLTRWFIRTSLVCFIAALLTGTLLAARGPLHLPAFFNTLTPLFFHLFMVGFVTQLIFGMVFWMFPKASKEQPRGSERLAWLTYGGLNVGLLLRVIAEPAQATAPHPGWGWLLVVSALLQWSAGIFFVLNTWNRVKER